MKSIPIQQDNVTQLSADDFNEIPRETENAIESADIVLSTSDLSQLAKSLAVYAGVGDFYEDLGIADDYILSTIGNRSYPPEYYVGQVARFIPGNTSTSVNAIAGIGGNGILPIGIGQLPDGGPFEIGFNQIFEGVPTTLVVAETPDGTKYFRIDTDSISNLSDGKAFIDGAAGWTMIFGPDALNIVNQSDGTECNVGRDVIYNEVSGGQSATMTDGRLECRRTNNILVPTTTSDWKGIGFGGGTHPNPDEDARFNKTYEDLTTSGLTFVSQGVGSGRWASFSDYSTDIPTTIKIMSVSASFTDANGDEWSSKCITKNIDNAGKWDLQITILTGGDVSGFEPIVNGMILTIEFDGQNLT